MSDVPGARARLEALQARLEAGGVVTREELLDELAAVLPMMTRVSPLRKGRVKAAAIDAAKRDQVKRLLRTYPQAHLQEIGRMAGVNPGRVSEILHGEYDHL